MWLNESASELVRGGGIDVGGIIEDDDPAAAGAPSRCRPEEAGSICFRVMVPTFMKEALAPPASAMCTMRSNQSGSSSPIATAYTVSRLPVLSANRRTTAGAAAISTLQRRAVGFSWPMGGNFSSSSPGRPSLRKTTCTATPLSVASMSDSMASHAAEKFVPLVGFTGLSSSGAAVSIVTCEKLCFASSWKRICE